MGSEGSSNNQFSYLLNADVGVYTSRNIFVVNNDNFRIQKFVEDTIVPTISIINQTKGCTFATFATEIINVMSINTRIF